MNSRIQKKKKNTNMDLWMFLIYRKYKSDSGPEFEPV